VKLKFSSSSFVRRKRNVGADADEERSGSCKETANEELLAEKNQGCIEGATQAIKAPAPYLYILNRTVVTNFTLRSISRGRERVGIKMQEYPSSRVAYRDGRDCKPCLIFEEQVSRVIETTSNIAHNEDE
jgi:hypothetical protein